MLTAEQIDALPAGEELDRLVAVALGCKPVSRGYQGKGCYECTCPHERHARILPHGYAGCGGHNEEPPSLFRYSASWDYAMKAAETIDESDSIHLCGGHKEPMNAYHREYWELSKEHGYWYCNFGGKISYADTGPLAICRSIVKYAKPE